MFVDAEASSNEFDSKQQISSPTGDASISFYSLEVALDVKSRCSLRCSWCNNATIGIRFHEELARLLNAGEYARECYARV